MKNGNYRMIAVTLYGLEEILAKELKLLGSQKTNILNRAVEFHGDLGFMYKANLNLVLGLLMKMNCTDRSLLLIGQNILVLTILLQFTHQDILILSLILIILL